MNSKNKKIAAWGFIVSLLVASVTIFKSNEPEDEVAVEVEVVEQAEPTQVEILTSNLEEEEIVVESAPLKDELDEHIRHFTDDGILIAPYPDYDNFSDAFGYARDMLGDSSEDGSLKVFVWRGEKYNTETLKQSAESVIEVVEPDTTVKDSTSN